MDVKPKVVAIIQARQGSTRLPGKTMKNILGRPLLKYLLERVSQAKMLQETIVATTNLQNDDPIAKFCEDNSVLCLRGDIDDVLGRYLAAAHLTAAQIVVRITGDCPLLAPEVIDKVVAHYLALYPEIDYVSNTLVRTYPRGMDVEVFSFESLKIAAERATKASEREHVTSFIYNHPELFRLANVLNEKDNSHLRWTVDTKEDFELVEKLIENLYPLNNSFTYIELLKAMTEHPEWHAINSGVLQKKSS